MTYDSATDSCPATSFPDLARVPIEFWDRYRTRSSRLREAQERLKVAFENVGLLKNAVRKELQHKGANGIAVRFSLRIGAHRGAHERRN